MFSFKPHQWKSNTQSNLVRYTFLVISSSIIYSNQYTGFKKQTNKQTLPLREKTHLDEQAWLVAVEVSLRGESFPATREEMGTRSLPLGGWPEFGHWQIPCDLSDSRIQAVPRGWRQKQPPTPGQKGATRLSTNGHPAFTALQILSTLGVTFHHGRLPLTASPERSCGAPPTVWWVPQITSISDVRHQNHGFETDHQEKLI